MKSEGSINMKKERSNLNRSPERAHGVALVAVLAVLTILAILAGAFAMVMSINRSVSMVSIAKVQSDLLASSAIEHTMSLLRQDVADQPAWDDLSENWHSWFQPGDATAEESVDVDGVPEILNRNATSTDARWIYVKNVDGEVVGRYAVLVEDEAAKINVNAAAALSPKMQNQGVGTFEIMLTDGSRAGLPISRARARQLLEYRYGRDKQPGQAKRDDNLTESLHALDEIDNDADGTFDEAAEGIDEPDEFLAIRPMWDDRNFSSISEMCDQFSDKPLSTVARRIMRKYGTVYSRNRDTFWDPIEKNWQKKVNLNVADRTQLHRVLRRANEEIPFEPSSKSLRNLVANIIDYRDENHVLSTMGSDYGVESVCFNEIMANEGSMSFQTDWGQGYIAYDPWYFSPCRNTYYENFGWSVQSFVKSGENYTLRMKEPQNKMHPQYPFYKMDLPWEPNFWKGAEVGMKNSGGTVYEFNVVSSAGGNNRELTISAKNGAASTWANALTGGVNNVYCKIQTKWQNLIKTGGKEASIKWYFPTTKRTQHPEYYYRGYLVSSTVTPDEGQMAGKPENKGSTKSYITEMDVDGDTRKYSPTQWDQLKYIYKGGQAMRANEYGYMPILATSSRKCQDHDYRYFNMIVFAFFSRPDIVELINVSDQSISLRNWQVVVNTGVEALTLDSINTAKLYSRERNGTYEDPNPVIKPNGYFYLTNNREIFDLEHANGDGKYGSGAGEQIPVYELTEKRWGITYPIVEVIPPYQIKVDGSDWKDDILKNELMMILSERESEKYNPPDGLILTIRTNSRNVLAKGRGFQFQTLGVEAGDRVMIFGLPRKGGFVSFTLKNEYGQIAARTTTYGTVEEEELGYSTEKDDPTHYTWIKNPKPTIGGTPRKAKNSVTYQSPFARPHIKNNRYTSSGELLKVRRADDWENVGASNKRKATQALKAFSKYFTISGIRLDAEETDAHISGWKAAFGTVRNSNGNSIEAANVVWQPGIWSGQKLTVLSGALSGEQFAITNSTRNSLTVAGYSTVKRASLRLRPGDTFSVGPGYSTSLYYTRKSDEAGIWEWENKNLEPMPYALYLFGLNDSIKTTEFLEENWNAEIDAGIFNFNTREYDLLPLEKSMGSHSSFSAVKGSTRMKYDKSDGLYCGTIKPEHISSKGGIRLKLTPHNLEQQDCSGFAWFDYAYLAPVGTEGKININTAIERVLGSLKNITPKLAQNIARGLNRAGKSVLKPYRDESALLDVAGITPDIYKDICNLITIRSDQFRVVAIAQTLTDTDRDGVFKPESGDAVISESFKEVVIDRSELTDGNADTQRMKMLR